jgi:hypothetical protein
MHPKTIEWDERLKALFDEIDHELENAYHGRFSLRANRPARGETSNPEADGLFNIGAFFTPGFGSELGRGYLVEIIVASRDPVPEAERDAIEGYVVKRLRELLPLRFPERVLTVEKDGSMWKIVGDLSLGPANRP